MHELTVHITRTDPGTYFVTGAPVGQRGGSLRQRDFPDDAALRDFLLHELDIDASGSELFTRFISPRGDGLLNGTEVYC